MADGNFASKVSATRDANAVANPIFVRLTDGAVAIGVTANALDVNITTASVTVDGTVAATQSGVWNIGTVTTLTGITNDVNIADGGNSITVDNAALSVVGGGTEATALRVTIANDSTGLISIDDGGGSITVDGTVTTTFTPASLDDSAFSVGVDEVVHTGFLADETSPDSVDEGDVGIARMTLDRKQLIVLVDKTTDANRLVINSDGSVNVNMVSAAVSGEVNDYITSTPAADASTNHDYPVANTTMLIESIIVSASGDAKFELQIGPIASLATKLVVFLTGKEGDTKQIDFNTPIEVPATSTGTVRIICNNRENQAMDVYTTLIGRDV